MGNNSINISKRGVTIYKKYFPHAICQLSNKITKNKEATIERRIEANENRFVMSLANVKYLNEMLIHSFHSKYLLFNCMSCRVTILLFTVVTIGQRKNYVNFSN